MTIPSEITSTYENGRRQTNESEKIEHEDPLPTISIEPIARAKLIATVQSHYPVINPPYSHSTMECSLPLKRVDSYSSDDESQYEEEASDHFDIDSAPIPKLSSSTIPIVMEFAPRNGGYSISNDPLFNGVCLYNTSTSSSATVSTTTTKTKSDKKEANPPLKSSWFFPSAFVHLLHMQQQRVEE